MVDFKRSYGAYLGAFLPIYAFLSGFVFFEPSLAEFAFALALPGLFLARGITARQWLIGGLLFLPTLASAAWAYFSLGLLDTRFVAIDLYLFAFYVLIVAAQRPEGRAETLRSCCRAMALASFIGIGVGLLLYVRLLPMPPGMRIVRANRLYGFFKDTNVFASYMTIPFLYYLSRFFSEGRRDRAAAAGAAVAVLGLGLLLSFSRAAWLGCALGALALAIVALAKGPRHTRARAAALVGAVAAAAAIVLWGNLRLGSVEISAIVRARLGFLSYDAGRFKAQALSFELLGRSPILGVGPGSYEAFSRLSAHSLYARILGERGIVGSLAFLAFAALAFAPAALKKAEAWLLAALAALLVSSFFIDSLHWRHLWLLLALLPPASPGEPAEAAPPQT